MENSRVLLLSPRELVKDVWRCGQMEVEDVLCSVDDVDLVCPRPRKRGEGLAARTVGGLSRRLAGADLSFGTKVEPVRIERDYDLLVIYAAQPFDASILEYAQGFRKRCKKAVVLVDELWLCHLQSDPAVQLFKQFDLLAVMFYNSVEPLQHYTGVPSVWVPPGLDTLRFFPGLVPPKRSIDVYSMGRRAAGSHEALSEITQAHGWTYLFDTTQVSGVRDSFNEHRQQLAELVKRTRYFIANMAKIDAPNHRGTQEELGFRSFEGAAGGAVLVGQTPDVPSLKQLFDWPDAHIHVPFESREVAQVIESLERDPARVTRIRRNNVVNSLRRHDFAYRWRSVLQLLGMAERPQLQSRLDQLESLARSVDQSDWPERAEELTGRRSIAI